MERYYKQREDVMFLKKRQFLIEREHFLDSQLDGYINDTPRDHVVEKGLDLIYAVNKVMYLQLTRYTSITSDMKVESWKVESTWEQKIILRVNS